MASDAKDVMPKSRYYDMLDLSGRRVLITGATAGIGERIAFRFAELHTELFLVGRRQEKLDSMKESLLAAGAKSVVGFAVDVTDKAAVEKMASDMQFHADVVVNNAGKALGVHPADEMAYDETHEMLDCNVMACMQLTQLFGVHMKKRGEGHMVYIGSVAGSDFYEGGAVYCATKAAINAYTMAYRMDVANTPIRVTTISPGLVGNTEFSQVRFSGDREKAAKVYADIVALHPDDVADQVIYACTRPRHVQIADIKCYATNQGHAKYSVQRVGDGLGKQP
mmetsp:Transcript_43417/g.122834  ORF Transcript_43417/g.122834 Transcript_43417/m.122834 type:complete len:280 (-) Transcript_43417:53-892(-)